MLSEIEVSLQGMLRLVILFAMALVSTQANANAIIPYMVVPWGQVVLLPIVVFIEAIIISKMIQSGFWKISLLCLLANIASTILGAVLYWFVLPNYSNSLFQWWFKGDFSTEPVRNIIISILFASLLWLISFISETAVLSKLRQTKFSDFAMSIAIANLTSYSGLVVLSAMFQR